MFNVVSAVVLAAGVAAVGAVPGEAALAVGGPTSTSVGVGVGTGAGGASCPSAGKPVQVGSWVHDDGQWAAHGGLQWAPSASSAPSWAADEVAYRYWEQVGWGPWVCG